MITPKALLQRTGSKWIERGTHFSLLEGWESAVGLTSAAEGLALIGLN